MKIFLQVLLGVTTLICSVNIYAEESVGSTQNILQKLQSEPKQAWVDRQTPVASNKIELLSEIQDGRGIFYELTRQFASYNPSPEEHKIKVNAFVKSLIKIIEAETGAPFNIPSRFNSERGACYFEDELVTSLTVLREYTFAVKLRAAPYQLTIQKSNAGDQKIKGLEAEFVSNTEHLKKCSISGGNSFDVIDKMLGEIGEAVSTRAANIKAAQRAQFGRQLSFEFLHSHVTNLQGVDVAPGQTTVEGFLENLITKAEIVRWTVKDNIYKIEAKYNGDSLLIELIHSPKTDSTALSGVLKKQKLDAEDVLGLSKIVYVK